MLFSCKATHYIWGRGRLHTLSALKCKSQSGHGMFIVLQKKITYSSINRLHPLIIKKSYFFQVFPGMSCRCIRGTSIFDDLTCQLENSFIFLYVPKNVSLFRDSGVCTINSKMETLPKLMTLLKMIKTTSSHVICCFIIAIYIFHRPLWRSCFLTENFVTNWCAQFLKSVSMLPPISQCQVKTDMQKCLAFSNHKGQTLQGQKKDERK